MADNVDFQILQGDQEVDVEIETGGRHTDISVWQDDMSDVEIEAEYIETKPVDIEVWQDDTQIVQVQIEVGVGVYGDIHYGDTMTGTGTARDPVNVAPDVMATIDNSVQEVNGTGNIVITRDNNTVTVSETTFVFEMAVAQTTWTIQHNLNKKPSVVVVDSANNSFEPATEWPDLNTVIITMNAPFKGTAYLN